MKILILLISIARTECNPELLRKLDNYLTGLENSIYINRQENQPTVYRGIATTKAKALEMAFKEIKEKKCPDQIRR